MSFVEYIWLILMSFFLVAYLVVLFQIVADIFRDSSLSGWWKAVWVLLLILLPVLTALVYLIARGQGMSDRQRDAVVQAKTEADAYIRQVATVSPADQIASAKELLDAGTITAEEFEALKAKALA